MPLRPDESTVKWFKNKVTRGGIDWQFVPNSMLISLKNPNGHSSSPWNSTDDVDRFTQALAHVAEKEENVDLQDIMGSSNVAKFEKTVKKLYGRYIAQAFSSNMRVDINKDTPNITFNGQTPTSSNYSSYYASKLSSRTVRSSVSSPKPIRSRDNPQPTIPAVLTQTGSGVRIRIVQNKIPKFALQAMLGFMTTGVILTKFLLRTKELLPREPYSIVGPAILVANGNILQHDTAGK
ncbi:hypothetical protein BU25DRAFT_453697 [Macroventuria anomochaeta]|uniref:Uncharacterized protein n=1 Tax=Macroventuria anomochaeta TaxID=301207 RepID=A0ACB6SI76_9PLEO|nr:uncharacterized protein BU25DRAFT_453697 [Macroventuria anomochaeta]KAF2633995.1 hypothetical protein BU25DRAFT_453697 [Macroventuria anomochaeta]